MEFTNAYQDTRRAAAYDELGLGNTYDLVFRNLPAILAARVHGTSAVDFGCGTGRSSRFLTSLGFATVGVDISAEMVAIAQERDPGGDYRVIDDGDLSSLPRTAFDLVLSAFTFDNVPGHERKVRLLRGLGGLLRPTGRLVNVVSTPDIYTHEWVTFSTRDYPENRTARCGDVVRIVTTDYSDARPVDDILWPDDAYRAVYAEAGLEVERVERPPAIGDEGVSWVSETEVGPWAIYLLRPAD
ncbi:MAG TPA: class I SAM-dependent methyltransferase, partial [Candidatus Sulfomarinibacteraceae bacterium]|nr:class I SAM-dependent methyltransferase [Candidatus Sulfomarinibacteraceae bacterium]